MMENQVNAYILAGGQNARMKGYPKGLLTWHGMPMVLYIANQLRSLTCQVYLNTNDPSYEKLDLPIVPDHQPKGNGPLEGVITCLLHSDKPFNLIVGCDMPFLNSQFLIWFSRQLFPEMNVLVPYHKNNIQPLCAFYNKALLNPFQQFERSHLFRLKQILSEVKATTLPIHPSIPGYHEALFANINTAGDYRIHQINVYED